MLKLRCMESSAYWLSAGMSLFCCVMASCESSTGASSKATRGDAPVAVAARKSTVSQQRPKPQKWRVPVGPRLGILSGKGLGPIRFGATHATIERHMGASCRLVDLPGQPGVQRCRYGAHAVEFFLEKGVLIRIGVHGKDRLLSKSPEREYGIFNGGFVEGARLEMLIAGVQEFLGKPLSVNPGPPKNTHGVVEVHVYSGARLEFDRSKSGKLKLAGVIIEPNDAK